MIKSVAVGGLALAVVLVGTHAAFAGQPPGGGLLCQLLPFLCQVGHPGHPGHPGNPAPAPLLAAGVPAFIALGGGVLVSRLFRRRKSAS